MSQIAKDQIQKLLKDADVAINDAIKIADTYNLGFGARLMTYYNTYISPGLQRGFEAWTRDNPELDSYEFWDKQGVYPGEYDPGYGWQSSGC